MKTMTSLLLALSIWIITAPVEAQPADTSSIRFGESALAFAAGTIQKSTPRDGIVNLITGDNQSTGDRMILGANDTLYLKLNNPHDVASGDLYTVYRRARKVFHPVTGDYLGFVIVRLAVVQVTQTDHALTTVDVVRSFGAIAPGDPVMRYEAPVVSEESSQVSDVAEMRGMIVELQADKSMTLVAQSDIVYLDRGKEDGLRKGDLLELHRHSQGLPSRKIGQLKVIATEDRTGTAVIVRASTRVMKGDRFKLAGHSEPVVLPVETPVQPLSQPRPLQVEKTVAEGAAAETSEIEPTPFEVIKERASKAFSDPVRGVATTIRVFEIIFRKTLELGSKNSETMCGGIQTDRAVCGHRRRGPASVSPLPGHR